jgi:hypothetical protein
MGGKVREEWRHLRSFVDPHLSLEKGLEMLPVMISDIDEWLEQLPRSAVATRDEKNTCIYVDATRLVLKPPFKLTARRMFGDLIDDKVICFVVTHLRSTEFSSAYEGVARDERDPQPDYGWHLLC